MIGPKLDARAYAILILAVVGVLITANLVAQNRSTSDSQAMIASATESVASATQQVAQSNADIAAAIRELAGAVREANRGMASQSGSAGAAGSGQQATQPGGQPQGQQGVFEMN